MPVVARPQLLDRACPPGRAVLFCLAVLRHIMARSSSSDAFDPWPLEMEAGSREAVVEAVKELAACGFNAKFEEGIRAVEGISDPNVVEIISDDDGVVGPSVDQEDMWDNIPVAVEPCRPQVRVQPKAKPKAPPAAWIAGQNCTGFIDKHRPGGAPVECGVLVANAVSVLEKALQKDTRHGTKVEHLRDASTVQLLATVLQRVQEVLGGEDAGIRGSALPVQVVATLVRLSPSQISKMSKKAHEAGKARAMRRRGNKHGREKKRHTGEPSRVNLRTMVRTALGNAVSGRSHQDFMHDMAQLQMAGLHLGTKYLNRGFPFAVEHVGALAVSQLAAKFVNESLPGLGIPSDIELFFDPGTIGKVFRSVRSTVLVTGFVISDPSSEDGSRAILVGAPPVSVNKKELEYEPFKMFLESSPVQLDRRRLRSRMAVSCTDGAYVEGEDSYHSATHLLLTHLWDDVGLPAKKAWDEFHRWNKVHMRAVKSVPLAAEFLQLTRDVDNVLGFGQGRLIDKQVAAFNDNRWLVGKAPGGTREFVYAAGIPDRFLAKWDGFYQAVDLRRDHSEEGRTGHDRHWWVDLGVKLASPSTLVFAVVHADVYAVMTPHVLSVQKPGLLIDVRARSLDDLKAGLVEKRRAIQRILPWVQWLPRVLHYLNVARDITLFTSVMLGRHFRRLPRMLGEMFGKCTWYDRRVCIRAPEPNFQSVWVHPVCQCVSWRRAGNPYVTQEEPGKAGGKRK